MGKKSQSGKTVSKIYDARGNGGGDISPTITGDHQNRITDYTAIVVEFVNIDREEREILSASPKRSRDGEQQRLESAKGEDE